MKYLGNVKTSLISENEENYRGLFGLSCGISSNALFRSDLPHPWEL